MRALIFTALVLSSAALTLGSISSPGPPGNAERKAAPLTSPQPGPNARAAGLAINCGIDTDGGPLVLIHRELQLGRIDPEPVAAPRPSTGVTLMIDQAAFGFRLRATLVFALASVRSGREQRL